MIGYIRTQFAVTFVALMSVTIGALAQEEDDVDRLMALMRIDDSITVMHLEGMRYGADLAQSYLPAAENEWLSVIAQIYDEDKMRDRVSADFREALQTADLAPMIAYFETENAATIIDKELIARHAFLSRDVEETAKRAFETLRTDNTELFDRVDEIIDDSDLVDFNVIGTLNSSLMFYRGLREGGAYEGSDDDMFAEIWATEDETREATYDWLGAFLSMAYEPLDPEILEEYATFFRTPAGQDLNRALFDAFDGLYEDMSFLVGYALATQLRSVPL